MKTLLFGILWMVSMCQCANAQNYDFANLIDMPVNAPAFKDFLAMIHEKPSMKAYSNQHYYASFYAKGFELLIADKKINTIFFHNTKLPGFSRFSRRMPYGVYWGMSRKDVRARLGAPVTSGGGKGCIMNEKILPWDNYIAPAYTMHITYDESGEVYELAITSRKR